MTILTGLDVLLNDHLDVLKNKRVGLLTNPTGVTRALQWNVVALREAQVNLVALFSPEHGLAASASPGEPVASGRDARTGLPIYSMYGNIRQPTREMLAGVDLLLFDLQDVGVRFYTFTTTLALTLEACAECGVPLIVLDRPNPINGMTTEGPLLDPALQSFVGYGRLPIRYGLTIGELARFYNQELQIGAELQVMALQGWRRAMWFDETGLTWVPPSPNMPHLSTAIVYPGTCLIEGTNLSVGRGTPLPFEIMGAPWVAAGGHVLAEELNALRIDGVRFRAITFTPSESKFTNENCFGVQMHVTDREALRPVAMGLHLICTIKQLHPAQFEWRAEHFDRLMGDASAREKIEQGVTVDDIAREWAAEQQDFSEKRGAWVMYE
jgi:uncharacterized protein YbbC (DUF1343 family)